MLTYCELDPEEQTRVHFLKSKSRHFHWRKGIWKKIRLKFSRQIVQGGLRYMLHISAVQRSIASESLVGLFNSLVPGWFERNFRYLIFQIISVIDGRGIACELALRWMSLDQTDDKSTLVQVMAWCHQATCHYHSQCWPRSLSPYGVTRPQWVKFHSILQGV